MSNETDDQATLTYHPSNVRIVAKETGYTEQAIIEVANFAAARGIQVKIAGIPFGSYRDSMNVETDDAST